MKQSCDWLWLITWGGSDGIPIPNLGFKWLCVFPLSFCHHCVHKLWLACCMMRSTSSGHPADSRQLPACKWGHPRPRLPPKWLMSKPSRDETGLGHFSRTFQLICWLVSGHKIYYLKSLGFEVVCHEAIANCYSPGLFCFLCLATLVLIILCFSHDLNKSLCWLLHSSAKAKALLGLPPPPSGVLPHPGDPSTLQTPVRPRPCGRFPEPSLPTPLPASCWVLACCLLRMALIYTFITALILGGNHALTQPTVLAALWILWGKKKILSFICYSNKQYSSSPVVASVHCSTVSHFLWPQGLSLTRLLCPWDSPGKNTGVGSHFLLQGIFSTQGWNPGLLHCRQILYCLSHQGRFPSSWCSINVCYMISIKCKERERDRQKEGRRDGGCVYLALKKDDVKGWQI